MLYLFQAASYGKKNGIWYAAPSGGGWNKSANTSRKASIVETDVPPPGGGQIKPSSGRVIRIINNMDHTVQVSFNLKALKPSELLFIIHLILFLVSGITKFKNITTFWRSFRRFRPSFKNEWRKKNVHCSRARGKQKNFDRCDSQNTDAKSCLQLWGVFTFS